MSLMDRGTETERDEGEQAWWHEPKEFTVREMESKDILHILRNRQELFDLLHTMTPDRRVQVEVVSDWRHDDGDYVYELLAINRTAASSPEVGDNA
jgi:hypothetical protein